MSYLSNTFFELQFYQCDPRKYFVFRLDFSPKPNKYTHLQHPPQHPSKLNPNIPRTKSSKLRHNIPLLRLRQRPPLPRHHIIHRFRQHPQIIDIVGWGEGVEELCFFFERITASSSAPNPLVSTSISSLFPKPDEEDKRRGAREEKRGRKANSRKSMNTLRRHNHIIPRLGINIPRLFAAILRIVGRDDRES